MVTWADVRLWAPGPLDELYDEVDHDERVAQELSEQLTDAASSISSQGEAAEAARERVLQLRDGVDELEALLTDKMIATKTAAANVRAVEERVDACYQFAQTNDLVLTDDGAVLLGQEVFVRAQFELALARTINSTATLEQQPSYLAAKKAQAELERAVTEVLETATSVDRAYASALGSISAGQVSLSSTAAAALNGKSFDPSVMWPGGTPVSEVLAEWDALSEAEQAALIQEHPEYIGQLNGVPFERRVEANDINIANTRGIVEAELEKLRTDRAEANGLFDGGKRDELDEKIAQLEREIAYYDGLLEGPGTVLFDRANDRIIEVVGDIHAPNLKDVLTYVAPTGGQWKNFVNGEIQLVTRDQVERGAQLNNPTAGFVYKDGPWVEWLFTDRGNANNDFLNTAGTDLAEFQAALELEGFAHNADTNIAGHSAGHSVVAASETSGAHYDQVFSLAGSYMPAGWEPTMGTEYDHLTYGYDAIHVLDEYSKFAHEHEETLDKVGDVSIQVGEKATSFGNGMSDLGSKFDFFGVDDWMRESGQSLADSGTYLNNMGEGFILGPDQMADTPHMSENYEKHSFEADYREDDEYRLEVKFGLPDPFPPFFKASAPLPPIDSHWRVSTGADRNGPVLEAMFKEMTEK